MRDPLPGIVHLVSRIEPLDAVELQHRDEALAWLACTTDVYRRHSAPVAPARHLVSYFALVDPDREQVLLGDHRKSGLWLPPGGHVEPGESPIDTVRRECREELGVDAEFLDPPGQEPLFITITDTVGVGDAHTDVSLWFCLAADAKAALCPDPGEYRSVHWWTHHELRSANPALFDPHWNRFLHKLTRLTA